MDSRKNYQTNSNSEQLILLAQINFDKEKIDSPMPTNGMLHFFITNDDMLGMNNDDQTGQNNFRVIYNENINYNITKEEVGKLNIPTSNEKTVEDFAIINECKISLEKGVDYIKFGDIQFENFLKIAYKKVFKKEPNKENIYFNILNDDERNWLDQELEINRSNHKMLGYSYFTQEDPRYNEKYKDYDTLLLQIDSEGKYVKWGGVGIGNFVISKKALLEKDFSNVLYNWDCT